MKNKFPRLNNALFQDEQLSKNVLSSIVGGEANDITEKRTAQIRRSFDEDLKEIDRQAVEDTVKSDDGVWV